MYNSNKLPNFATRKQENNTFKRGGNPKQRQQTMNTQEQINFLRRAYNLGKRHAENGNYCSWYTPRLGMAYELGYNGIGVDFENIVSGYRYGVCPEHESFNYADNRKEWGVSLAALDGKNEVGSSIWFCDRKKVNVSGLLIDETGSDGEPLIIPLDMKEQYDF